MEREIILDDLNAEQLAELDNVIQSEFLSDQFKDEDIAEADLLDMEGKVIEQAKKLTYQERKNLKDEDFALIQYVVNKKTGEKIKVRRFPIYDANHVRNCLQRLPQAKNLTNEERQLIKTRTLKKAKELNMTDIVEKHKAELEAECPECPCVEEKPVKRVSVYTSYCTDTYNETTGSWKSESNGTTRTTEIFKDGREVVTESANNSLYDSYVQKYTITQGQLDEKVATTKAEVEDKVRTDKDVEIAAIKSEVEQKEKATKEQSDAAILAKDTEIASLKAEKDGVIANKDVEIASLKVEVDKGKKELEKKQFTVEDIQKAKDDTTKIVARRILLGDEKKEISEAELLDDKEFEIKKLKKENEVLRASKGKDKPDFKVGGIKEKNEIGGVMRKLVDEYAHGKTE